MKIRQPYLLLLAVLLGLPAVAQQRQAPNILLVLVDDMGYGDIGATGNAWAKTPTIDRLAKQGISLQQFYVSPVCSPTRASIMTGQHSLRTGVLDTYLGGAILKPGQKLLPQYLQELGYQTFMAGKWHLGESEGLAPHQRGFGQALYHSGGGLGQVGDLEENYRRGDFVRDSDPSRDSCYWDPVLLHNGKQVSSQGYCSDVFAQAMGRFIAQRDRAKPFFGYLAFNAPHDPLLVPGQWMAPFAQLGTECLGPHASSPKAQQLLQQAQRVHAMVANIDHNLNLLLQQLRKEGIERETLIIFCSDNGPQHARFNAGLNGLKSSVLEGGIRSPCYWYWPGRLKPGQVQGPAQHFDLLPTLVALAGGQPPAGIDGQDLSRQLRPGATLPPRTMLHYWTRLYPETYNNMAVQQGRWKLVGHLAEGNEEQPFSLYDLEADPGEQHDLVASQPAQVQQLRHTMDSMLAAYKATPGFARPYYHLAPSQPGGRLRLSRNDWLGLGAKNWKSPEAAGTWLVQVPSTGSYVAHITLIQPFPFSGKMHIRHGDTFLSWKQRVDPDKPADQGPIKLVHGPFTLQQGKHTFACWMESYNRIFTPFDIYLERVGP